MPESSPGTFASRLLGQRTGMHGRRDGTMINRPWDILEALGDLVIKDNPNPATHASLRIGRPPVIDGSNIFAALKVPGIPSPPTKQNTTKIPLMTSSVAFNEPIVDGAPHPLPNDRFLAELPPPPKPIVVKDKVALTGYAASTADSPHWYFITGINAFGQHTEPSDPTPFQLAGGASWRIQIEEGWRRQYSGIGIWMAEPGTSRPERPGTMRLQKEIYFAEYFLPYYDMTGSYMFDPKLVPTADETYIGTASTPNVKRFYSHNAMKVGWYYFRIYFATASGDGLPGPMVGPFIVNLSPMFSKFDDEGNVEEAVGAGHFLITRGVAPQGATGWYAQVFLENQWHNAFNKFTGEGDKRPWSLDIIRLQLSGWSGSEEFAINDLVLLAGNDGPSEDTSGMERPQGTLPEPLPSGVQRPQPGDYGFARSHTAGVLQSPMSEETIVNIAADEIPRVILTTENNQIPNGTYTQTSPDGLPLDHNVTIPAGSMAKVAGGDANDIPIHWGLDKMGGNFLMWTVSPQTGPTVESGSMPQEVNPAQGCTIEVSYLLEYPPRGAFSGKAEIVMREKNTAGTITDTVIHTATAVGEYHHRQIVNPSTGTGIKLKSDTKTAEVVARMAPITAGGPKNMTIRLLYKILRPHSQGWGWLQRRFLLVDWWLENYNNWWAWFWCGLWGECPEPPPTEQPPPLPPPPPPGGDTSVEPPPPPPAPPDPVTPGPANTSPQEPPHRPTETSPEIEALNFNAGLPSGGGWSTHQTGNGAVSAATAAELAGVGGGMGLRSLKTVAGALSTAHIRKIFAPDVGLDERHSLGVSSRARVNAFAGTGSIHFDRICRPADGEPVAWKMLSSEAEVSELTIDDSPLNASNVEIILDGVSTNVMPIATKEVQTLSIPSAPTAPGTITINLPGAGVVNVVLGGNREVVQLKINSSGDGGTMTLNLGGTNYSVDLGWFGSSASNIAAAFASKSYAGWSVVRSGTTLTFTANLPGPRTDSTFNPGGTDVSYTLTIPTQGSSDTAQQLADRIRATVFPGWTPLGTTTDVLFTSNTPGDKSQGTISTSGGVTWAGTAPSLATTTPGTVDTPEALAARIRGTAFSGWTLGGSGAVVRFTANAAGVKQNAQYNPGTSGADGRMVTIVEGTGADFYFAVKDAQGMIHRRKIVASLNNTHIPEIDLHVNGAGDKQAVVEAWGGVAGTTPIFLGLLEDIDLTGLPVGMIEPGVVLESSAALTWDIHFDDYKITERGRTHHEIHNSRGEYINQLIMSYPDSQPLSQGLGYQEGEVAAEPGEQYMAAVKVSWENLPTGQRWKLCFFDAIRGDGVAVPIGDISGAVDFIDTSDGWVELVLPITIPENCYLLRFASRDISSGEAIAQQLVISPGTEVDRSGKYAVTGSYTATLQVGIDEDPYMLTEVYRERRELGMVADEPAGTSVTTTYASSDSQGSGFSVPVSDPEVVPDREFVNVYMETTTPNGWKTPVIRANNPYALYRIAIPEEYPGTLLLKDRGEISGGIVFTDIKKWYRKKQQRVSLPRGRIKKHDIYDPIGYLPEDSKFHCFTPEARNYLLEHWEELFTIEAHGEALTVSLFEEPKIDETPSTRMLDANKNVVYELYEGTLSWCEVLEVQPLV